MKEIENKLNFPGFNETLWVQKSSFDDKLIKTFIFNYYGYQD